MWVILIPVFFFQILLLFWGLGSDLREGSIKAFLFIFGLVVISTEILSLLEWITIHGLRNFWLAAILIGWFCLYFYREPILARLGSFRTRIKQRESTVESGKPGQRLLFVFGFSGIVLIMATTLLVAYLAPPNNFDSMTYHMARVAHWIQNQSIKFYPTAIPRQNYSLPLAEYGILHLQILSRSDKFANLVQWSSFLMAVVVATKLAAQIGLKRNGQLLSGVLAATVPMAILQSTSTQNDLVVGVFCLAFGYFLLKVVRELAWQDVVFASLAMGSALLTKGTGYIYCAGIGASIAGVFLIGNQWGESRKLLIRFLIIILGALMISTGHFARNMKLYSHPLSTENSRITADSYSLKTMFANMIRNGAVHLATPLPAGNSFVNQGSARLLGDQINDPDSTFAGTEFEIDFNLNEDYSGNLLHFLLLGPALIGTVLRWKDISRDEFALWLALIISVLLFNILLKWQPWGSRLQTPLFLLGTVIIARFIQDFLFIPWIRGFILGIFLLYSLPFLFLNTTRPVLPLFPDQSQNRVNMFLGNRVDKFFLKYSALGDNLWSVRNLYYDPRSIFYTKRKRLYFLSNSSYFSEYRDASNEVDKYQVPEIGLLMGSNDWEYPIWVLLGRHASQGSPRIRHIMVEDISGTLEDQQLALPPLIVATNQVQDGIVGDKEYRIAYQADSIQVLVSPEITD